MVTAKVIITTKGPVEKLFDFCLASLLCILRVATSSAFAHGIRNPRETMNGSGDMLPNSDASMVMGESQLLMDGAVSFVGHQQKNSGLQI